MSKTIEILHATNDLYSIANNGDALEWDLNTQIYIYIYIYIYININFDL